MAVWMIRFCKLRQKEVVNCIDGKRLGFICDLVLEECDGKICSIIVPGQSKLSFFVKGERDFIIPWRNIRKIGEDVILVELDFNCMPGRD